MLSIPERLWFVFVHSWTVYCSLSLVNELLCIHTVHGIHSKDDTCAVSRLPLASDVYHLQANVHDITFHFVVSLASLPYTTFHGFASFSLRSGCLLSIPFTPCRLLSSLPFLAIRLRLSAFVSSSSSSSFHGVVGCSHLLRLILLCSSLCVNG